MSLTYKNCLEKTTGKSRGVSQLEVMPGLHVQLSILKKHGRLLMHGALLTSKSKKYANATDKDARNVILKTVRFFSKSL